MMNVYGLAFVFGQCRVVPKKRRGRRRKKRETEQILNTLAHEKGRENGPDQWGEVMRDVRANISFDWLEK